MITKAFGIYDSKAHAFGVPFFMVSVGAAVRAFSDLGNESGSGVNRHPSDYVLYEIGSFDDSNGEFISLSPHVHLGIGSDFVDKRPVRYNPAASDLVKVALDNPLATAEELSNGS